MARPKESSSKARERLIEAAGRGFRTGGFGGTGVDGLAKEAGLTSGAFYTHFASKTEAFRLALHEGFEFFQRGIATLREQAGKNWLPALVNHYFKERMEVDLCEACVLPSLTADATRADDATRIAYEADLQKLAETLATGMPGKGATERSWTLLALFAGGASIARAVKDKTIRATILGSVRESALKVCEKH
jgi:TetR/AcrR family transcriptional repressor of nem operon